MIVIPNRTLKRQQMFNALPELLLVGGRETHDILLCVDQVDAATWARLNARLRRRPAAGTVDAAGAQRTGQADLR